MNELAATRDGTRYLTFAEHAKINTPQDSDLLARWNRMPLSKSSREWPE